MTITHNDIYKRFLIEYDKANITSSYPSLTVYEAVAILNKAYVALISQKLTGNNPRRASFEADLKAIEDLQPLIKTSGPHTVQQYIFGAENEYIIEYPLDMMYYLQSFLRGSDNKTHNTNLITHQSALEFKKTAINTPWIEQPVVYMENNLIHTLVDDSVDTDGLNAYITYIKTPEWFEVELVEGYEEDPSEWYPTTPQQQNPFILAEEGRVAAEEARVLAESERQDSEETRQLAEQQRTSAEEQRDAAESLRITAETLRDDEETLRNSAELQRRNGEQTRISYEEDRELAEQARSTSELGRVTAELSRATAEVERNTAENSRVTAESSRQTLESNRADAEGQRASAEISRIATEENRNSAELSRVANESSRVLAELARVSAENQRVAAEQLRLAAVTVAQQDIEDLLENKADVNGYYETLGAGVATNLRGGLIHDHQFVYRKTGGNEEVLSDLAYVTKIKGNTVVWNQLVNRDTSAEFNANGVVGSFSNGKWNYSGTPTRDAIALLPLGSWGSVIAGHKYYMNIEGTRSAGYLMWGVYYSWGNVRYGAYGIFTPEHNSSDVEPIITGLTGITTFTASLYYTLIDLTLMFGAGNEPTTVEEFEAWLATNIGLKDYYEYCSGKLVSFGGTTVKMNQLVRNGDFENKGDGWTFSTVSNNNVDFTENNAHITGQANYYVPNLDSTSLFDGFAGHKYYLSCFCRGTIGNRVLSLEINAQEHTVTLPSSSSSFTKASGVIIAQESGSLSIRVYGKQDTSNAYDFYLDNILCIDLTEMFGAGNEPTKEWCDEHFTSDYYPYHTGYETNLLNITGQQTGIKSVGFNLWDEEWEEGVYNQTDGNPLYVQGRLRSKNPIKVVKDVLYYIKSASKQLVVLQYDEDLNYLHEVNTINSGVGVEVSFASACGYIKFYTEESYPTYNNDICISISDTTKNGTYEAHKEAISDMSWVRTLGIENFNIWDEEWENGVIDQSTGVLIDNGDRFRSKNFIPCTANTTYYSKSVLNLVISAWDSRKNYIGIITNTENIEFTTPSNCAFLKFYTGTNQSTYNHDICINKSIPHFNGRYYPYGVTAPYFPNGLCKAGGVFDEVKVENGKIKGVVRIGSVDLGSLTWTHCQTVTGYNYADFAGGQKVSSEHSMLNNGISEKYAITIVAGFNDSMTKDKVFAFEESHMFVRDSELGTTGNPSGKVIYELETPYEFEIENIYLPPLKVDNGGTEQILPDNSPNVITCAPILSIMYGLNAAETLKSLPTNYISVLSLDSLIGCIQSALDINITKTWEPGLNRYVFTFEQNELQTEPGEGE